MSDTPRTDSIMNCIATYPQPETIVDFARELERENAALKAAHLHNVHELGELSAENAKLREGIPHIADGKPILIGDTVWFFEEDSREPLSAKVTSTHGKDDSPAGHVYPGRFVVTADWYEDGDAKFYSTKEAVPTPVHL